MPPLSGILPDGIKIAWNMAFEHRVRALVTRFWLTCLTLAATLLFAAPASASLVFTLDQGTCCGAAPFGTVKLSTVTSQEVLVTVTLNGSDKFPYTGNGVTHQSLDFNIAGNPTISITNLTTGFQVGPAPASPSGFGTFDYSITCPACGPGGSHAKPGPLTFDVSVSSGTLSISNFIANTLGYYFAADILVPVPGHDAKTGNVGSKGPGVRVPEPTTIFIFAAGLVGAAAGPTSTQKNSRLKTFALRALRQRCQGLSTHFNLPPLMRRTP